MRDTPRMRRLLLAPLTAALLLTGCGDSATTSTDTLTPIQAIAQVGAKTSAAGTSKFAITTTVDAGGEDVTIGGEGAFALDGTKGRLTLEIPGAGAVELRLVDGTAFLQVPQAPGWYSVPFEKLAGSSLATSTDPTSSLDQLAEASSDVEEVGTETVRGAETTRYSGTLDMEKALAAATGPQKAALEKSLASLKETKVPFDAWIDEEGRMRKLTQQLTVEQDGRTGTAEVTLEFFDFGTAVDVTAPPAAEVQDGTQLLSGFLGA
jgi:hypothetical protein